LSPGRLYRQSRAKAGSLALKMGNFGLNKEFFRKFSGVCRVGTVLVEQTGHEDTGDR
jgi:hypothetical protein